MLIFLIFILRNKIFQFLSLGTVFCYYYLFYRISIFFKETVQSSLKQIESSAACYYQSNFLHNFYPFPAVYFTFPNNFKNVYLIFFIILSILKSRTLFFPLLLKCTCLLLPICSTNGFTKEIILYPLSL